MVKVRDVMTTDLVTVTPSDTVRDAAEAMSFDHVSGLPVVDGGRAVGVISATDVLDFAADSMGTELERSGEPGADQVPDGAQWNVAGGLPGGYYGEDWGWEDGYMEHRLPATDRPEWNALEETTVSELMTRAVHSVSADAEVREAARAMLDAGVRRLLVVDAEDRLVGVISSTDVMRAVAQEDAEL